MLVKLYAPLQPGSKEEIRLLEAVLYTATVFGPGFTTLLSSSEDKSSIIKELSTAAAVFARFKANYSYGLISEELGVPEKTIRKYLRIEDALSKAVSDVLKKLEAGNGFIEVDIPDVGSYAVKLSSLERENNELRQRNQELETQLAELRGKLELVKKRLDEVYRML